MQNTVNAGSYITVDSTLGYAFRGYSISVSGYNLTNRRDPVLRSELGEGQFYLLPGRRLFVRVSASL
jgi:outer membrane receptor protein involved in Fe transport